MAKAEPQPHRTIACYHCGHRFETSARTMSTSCKKCSNSLKVEDITIKGPHSVRKIQTCGRILVEVKGLLLAPIIQTGDGLEVKGSLEGNVTTYGPVVLGPKARWKGDCKAPALTVELGAIIHKGYFEIARPPPPPPAEPATHESLQPPPAAPDQPPLFSPGDANAAATDVAAHNLPAPAPPATPPEAAPPPPPPAPLPKLPTPKQRQTKNIPLSEMHLPKKLPPTGGKPKS